MSAPKVVEGWLRVTAYLHAGRPQDGHLLAAQILAAGAGHGLAGGAVFAGVHGYSVRYEQHKPAHQRNWAADQPVMVAMVGPAHVVEAFLPTPRRDRTRGRWWSPTGSRACGCTGRRRPRPRSSLCLRPDRPGRARMEFDVVVEIPRNTRNKYEWDPVKKRIRLDRMLFTSTGYPYDYGFIPNTIAVDGDALDAMVLVEEPTFPGILIRVRPVAVYTIDRRGPGGPEGDLRAGNRPS